MVKLKESREIAVRYHGDPRGNTELYSNPNGNDYNSDPGHFNNGTLPPPPPCQLPPSFANQQAPPPPPYRPPPHNPDEDNDLYITPTDGSEEYAQVCFYQTSTGVPAYVSVRGIVTQKKQKKRYFCPNFCA